MKVLLALAEDRRLVVAAVSALSLVGGSFMPWSETDIIIARITEYGSSAGGRITFVLGLVALGAVLAYAVLQHADLAVAAAAAALASAGIAGWYRFHLLQAAQRAAAQQETTAAFRAETGAGVWMVIGGGLVLAVAVGLAAFGGRRETER